MLLFGPNNLYIANVELMFWLFVCVGCIDLMYTFCMIVAPIHIYFNDVVV